MNSIRIKLDRIIAKGKLWIVVIVTLGILLLPCVVFFTSEHIIHFLSTDSVWNEGEMGGMLDSYESYINPSFDGTGTNPERGYKLLIAYLGAFLLNGLLVSLVVSWFQNRRERWEQGDLHYRKWEFGNYCVVIGGNEIVPDLVRQLLDKYHYDHILVMTNRDVPTLRKKMVSILGRKEPKIVLYFGERTSEEDLKLLQVQGAKEIYVIGEQLDINQTGSHHDVKNMECVQKMARILRNSPFAEKKKCRVMFEYQSSFSVFQFTDINDDISSVLDFRPFNYYEIWAQNVFVYPHLDVNAKQANYLPLEGIEPITGDSESTVHLIVVGMSRMGIAMGIEAAQIAHYPNFVKNKEKELRTRITFIDSEAKKEMRYLQGHYKELFAVSRWRYFEANDDNIYYHEKEDIPYDADDVSWHDPLCDPNSHSPYRNTDDYTLGKKLVDVDWEFIQGDLETPTIQRYISEATSRKDVRLTIAVCIPKDNTSFAASLYLPDDVYEDNNNVVQVLAYQPYGDAMCLSFMNRIEMTGNSESNRQNNFNQFAKLKAFGMMDSCYNINDQEKMELAADQLWIQYEKTYSGRVGGRKDLRKVLNNEEPLSAGKSLAANQWSNTYAAAHLWTKLRSINWDGKSAVNKEDRKILAELEHIRWNMEQLLLGFAPLRPEEQKRLYEKLDSAINVEVPDDELLQLLNNKKESIEKEQFKKLGEWLDAWKDFDEEREIMKANMSHLDICSVEILSKVDKEAIRYDEDLTSILPVIYSQITKDLDCNKNGTINKNI